MRQFVCPACGATNRAPEGKDPLAAKCGRCGEPLFNGRPAEVDAKAYAMVAQRHRAAGGMALLSAIAWLPSVGPHKFFTEVHAPLLAPVIVVGSACVLVLALAGVRLLRRQREAIARGRVQPG